jgi:hypothetical protein
VRASVSWRRENGAAREIHRVVSSGGSFGASPLRPHFGLGKAASVDLIEIRWPGSGRMQQFHGPIAADAVYAITEGAPELRKAAPPRKAVAAR